MKKSNNSKTPTPKPAEAAEKARAQLASAETAVRAAKEESRAAKRKRKQAKEAARLARKRFKQAKKKLSQAKHALALAEEELARETARAARAKKLAQRFPGKPKVTPIAAKKRRKPVSRAKTFTLTEPTPEPTVREKMSELARSPNQSPERSTPTDSVS